MREGIPPFPHISGHGEIELEHFAKKVVWFTCITRAILKNRCSYPRRLSWICSMSLSKNCALVDMLRLPSSTLKLAPMFLPVLFDNSVIDGLLGRIRCLV